MGKRVYVGNLPFSYGFKELKELFSSYGEIEDAVVITDKEKRRSRGFGFVTFPSDVVAEKAIAEMNKKNVEGREIIVKEALERENSEEK